MFGDHGLVDLPKQFYHALVFISFFKPLQVQTGVQPWLSRVLFPLVLSVIALLCIRHCGSGGSLRDKTRKESLTMTACHSFRALLPTDVPKAFATLQTEAQHENKLNINTDPYKPPARPCRQEGNDELGLQYR